MAANTDKFLEVGIAGTATTLSSPGHLIGGTSITVGSTTNWPTNTGVAFAIDRAELVNGVETQIAGTYTEWIGTVASATSITNLTLSPYSPNSDQNYSAGSLTRVYIPVTATVQNKMATGIVVEHNQDGTHDETLITSRTADTAPASGDSILTYDTSATALKKVTIANLWANPAYTVSTPPVTGWVNSLLPSVSSVTYNGNRSYDVTFGSSVASYLTPGMRLRTTRTVAAPTTVFSLDGSNDYYNKTSPSGMTFTDDFVVSAWIRLSSYPAGDAGIISRYNGTSGYIFNIDSSGRVNLFGANGGAANFSTVKSYQSVPLNKWVHVTAQLDMSSFTATTTTSYVMLDGVDVPAAVSRGGTNPTALVQAGNLEIGSYNSGTNVFPGQITDVMIFSAKVTQATMRGYMSQKPTGSETNLISAYSNGSTTDLNTGNANNLTAQNGATTSSSYAPYTVDSNGTPGGSYDYAIVTKVATTTATCQVPEGCTIATSGGVSAVDLSSVKVPYGFPADEGRWRVETLHNANGSQSSPVSGTWYNIGSIQLTIPIGAWVTDYQGTGDSTGGVNGAIMYATISTGASSETDKKSTGGFFMQGSVRFLGQLYKRTDHSLSSATLHYLNAKVDAASVTTIQWNTDRGIVVFSAKPAHL